MNSGGPDTRIYSFLGELQAGVATKELDALTTVRWECGWVTHPVTGVQGDGEFRGPRVAVDESDPSAAFGGARC